MVTNFQPSLSLFFLIIMDSWILKIQYFNQLQLFCLMLRLSQLWSVETLLSWVLCSYNMTSLIFKSVLAFWPKMSHIHLYLPCSRPGIHQSLLQGALAPFSRE